MRQDEPTPRPQVRIVPSGEALESRQLLTGGAGSIFAIVPGEVIAPGQAAEVHVAIDSTRFTTPRNSLLLGIDVAPASGSNVKPRVDAVVGEGGGSVRPTMRSTYSPYMKDDRVVTGARHQRRAGAVKG